MNLNSWMCCPLSSWGWVHYYRAIHPLSVSSPAFSSPGHFLITDGQLPLLGSPLNALDTAP